MSDNEKNVLYIGKNIALVEAILSSICGVAEKTSYNIKHMLNSNEVLALLSEKPYHYLISEQAIAQPVSDKIKQQFPKLHVIYLPQPQIENEKVAPVDTQKLFSDEVKKVLDCIGMPIYYKDKEGKILICNSCFANELGLKTDEVIGKNSVDILPLTLQKGIEVADKKILDEHHVQLYRCDLNDLQGNSHEVVFRKEMIAGTDIQIGMVFDVSELAEVKRSNEKERMMLRATADVSSDLIFFKDLQSRFLGCNKQFEKFIGKPESDIIGKTDEQFFDSEQALMCQKQDQQVMLNNEIYSGEEYLTYVNGERHFIEMKKVPLLNRLGEVQGIICIGRDITANHLLQKRLRVANVVFENSQDNIIVTDQSGIILSANIASTQLTGYRKSELLGRDIRMLSTSDPSSAIAMQVEQALKEDNQWKGEVTYRNKAKEIQFAWLEIYVVEQEKGLHNRIYAFTDFKQNKNIERKIQYLSKHDPLTGVANRIALFSKLEDAITRANFNEVAMAVVLIDINNFKAINDRYGHDVGDKALQEIAARLKNCAFEKDTVARFGDDKFVIVVDSLKNEHDAAIVAQKVASQFLDPFSIGDVETDLTATIGISLCPDDGVDVDELLQSAEKALQRAKLDKKSAYHFYTGQLTEHSSSQLKLEGELKAGLEQDQFEVFYQPQFDLNSKLIVTMESVLRWRHPVHGLLLPERFISLAEEAGLINTLTLMTCKKVALQTVEWRKSGIHFGRLSIMLPISFLENIHFIADIQAIIQETGCIAKDIEFEVAKSVVESGDYTVCKNLLNIKKLGISIVVSGFGADISTFQLIDTLGIEKFKIAQNSLQVSPDPIAAESVIKSVKVLAGDLGVSVVGERVETLDYESLCLDQHPMDSGKVMKASEATFFLRCHKKK